MKKTTLVIMAAGIGSRFGGGIKQLAKVGPNDEVIMDYSVYDAVRAGFNKIVFIIRKDIEEQFKEIIGDRISKHVNIRYAIQSVEDLPDGYKCPESRTNPWGTGHAVLSAKDFINEPFAIINADDYYGKEAFELTHKYLVSDKMSDTGSNLCLAGFILENTLSSNGTVTRAICKEENGKLTEIKETYEIQKLRDGSIVSENDKLDKNSVISMNMWGCPTEFIKTLENEFKRFLDDHIADTKSEFLIPTIIGDLLKKGDLNVDVLKSHDKWFGVTYAEDKEYVKSEIKKLVESGVYPEKLWGE